MRHFLLPDTPATHPGGMHPAAAVARLVAPAGLLNRSSPSPPATVAGYSRRRSRPGRGRSNCKRSPGGGRPRTRTDGPIAPHLARRRRRGMDERSHSQDARPACVPGTVWGTAPMLNRQVARGAVLAHKLWQALAALSLLSPTLIRARAPAGGGVPAWPARSAAPPRTHRRATPIAVYVRILTAADTC
jgi:hypothetical protein